MKTTNWKKTSFLTLILSGFISLGLAGCASDEEKAMDEQRQEEEYFGPQEQVEETDETVQQQQEEDVEMQDEFDIGEDTAMQGEEAAVEDKPWADQQVALDKVEQVQEELNNKGFNAGNTDGLIGPNTSSALKNFQEANDLTASGELNQETIDALGLDIDLQEAQQAGEETRMAE